MLSRRGDGDGFGLRPARSAVGDGIPGPDARAGTRRRYREQLTALLEDVLRRWTGPLPRLAYITDGGYHQTRYYRQVLQRMSDPRHPGQRLSWAWVIDYYHACEYVYKMSEALFSDSPSEPKPGRGRCVAG